LEYIPESDPARSAELKRVVVCDEHGVPRRQVTTADTLNLRIELIVREARPDLKLAFVLYDALQNPIFSSCPIDDGLSYPTEPGYYEFQVAFPAPLLMPQRYSISVAIYSGSRGEIHTGLHILAFEAAAAHAPIYSAEPNRMGLLQMLCHWKRLAFRNEGDSLEQHRSCADQSVDA
jgi:hypothetical protein